MQWSGFIYFYFHLKGHFLSIVLKLLTQDEKLEIFSLKSIAQNANSQKCRACLVVHFQFS